jgi:PAS domain S-box-containing protein
MQGQDVWCTLTLETGQALGVHTTENRLGEVQITTQVWDTPNAALVAQTQAPQAIRLALVAEPTVRGTLTVARHPEAPALTGSMLTMLDLFAQMGALALAQRRLVDRWQEQADHFVRLSTTLQQAHAETQFLSHLLMSTQDGILGTDLNQQIRFCNPQATALLGQEQTTLLGAQLATVFPAAVQQEVAQRSDMVCHGGMQAAFVFTHHLPARPARYMSLRLAPITNAQQAQVGMAAVLSDITARLQLEVEQQQAYKMQAVSTLAGGIAHDFNNILAAIMGFTELALADLPDVSRVSQHLEEVINASRRATQIVQQLLTFSHTERADRQAIQLSRVVQEVVTLLRGSLPTTITVQEQYLAERDTILATPVQMRQMLMNLWLNAVYAMRDTGGTLAIQVDTVVLTDTAAEPHLDLQPGAYVRLRVCDTGMGMTPEVVNRIFEPFFTTRRTGEGSGMGLAMVHGIIRQHGGTITVQSAPQAGTTFVILLPGHEDARLAIP